MKKVSSEKSSFFGEMKKSKNKMIIILFTVFVFLLVSCVLSVVIIAGSTSHILNNMPEQMIFSDYSDLEKLQEYTVSTINDKNTENLDVNYGIACIVEWENTQYKVYAYEFSDSEDAREYLSGMKMAVSKNVTKQYNGSGGVFAYTDRFYYENKVLIVKSTSIKKNYQFITWLQEDFEISW